MLRRLHTQDGDIIAPELTPLKASWQNSQGDDDEGGSYSGVDSARTNGQSKAKTRLF